MKTAFQLVEEHGLTLHGDIEHFAELVRGFGSRRHDRLPTPMGGCTRPTHLQVRPMWCVHEDHQMTEEDEEFNRIEREAAMRMEAVRATVAPREWVGLTDDEIDNMVEVTDLSGAYYYDDLYAVVRAAEAKLREKNS